MVVPKDEIRDDHGNLRENRLPWPGCPHPLGSSSGAPFNPQQLGRRHLGNGIGIQGGEGGNSGCCKKCTEYGREDLSQAGHQHG